MKYDECLASPFVYILRRLLVLGLCVSFVLCLLAVGVTTELLSDLRVSLPYTVQVVVIVHPIVLLLVPLSLLFVCSAALYYSTRGVISGPARYLDERQKLLRDKAYHSAYRIIIMSCVIVGAGLLLHAAVPPASTLANSGPSLRVLSLHASALSQFNIVYSQAKNVHVLLPHASIIFSNPKSVNIVKFIQPAAPPAAPSSGMWSYTILFASLLLLISTLPRSVIAWNKQM